MYVDICSVDFLQVASSIGLQELASQVRSITYLLALVALQALPMPNLFFTTQIAPETQVQFPG